MQLGVLVVDDEEGIRRSVSRVLREEGYSVQGAGSGEEALKIVHHNPQSLDIVICDLLMPGIDGIKTIDEISKVHREITRIILTGYGTLDASIKAIELGVEGFITKPFENRDLKWKVKECYLKKKLRQFIAPDIFNEVLSKPSPVEPTLSRITILFSDIRGFTRICREKPPDELAALLNRHYFHPMSEIIIRHGGMIDKYIGDSIMALFGAPVSREKHEERAVACAVDMVKALESVNGIFEVGIGISSGDVVTGIFGSINKKEYTALGTPVNIAARLQKMARSGDIIISEETRAGLNGLFSFQHAGTIEFMPSDPPVVYYRRSKDD